MTGTKVPQVGCRFANRCPIAIDICHTDDPPLWQIDGRTSACHRAEEVISGTA